MSVSDFDLAAALGLDRPLETARMLAMVAERRKQRDDARRQCCEIMAASTANPEWTAQHYANQYGWGYLYPEEPEPDTSDPGQPNMPGRSAMCVFEHLGPCDCHACAAFKAANS